MVNSALVDYDKLIYYLSTNCGSYIGMSELIVKLKKYFQIQLSSDEDDHRRRAKFIGVLYGSEPDDDLAEVFKVLLDIKFLCLIPESNYMTVNRSDLTQI